MTTELYTYWEVMGGYFDAEDQWSGDTVLAVAHTPEDRDAAIAKAEQEGWVGTYAVMYLARRG